mmetsp:Transcript_49196/g.93965  ORF Transcript_49196/g.93965 Transcript_49196/m.93965 type:complete len:234 (-) Transcript_49196:412-1113(-)
MQRDLAQAGQLLPLPPVLEEDPDHVLVLLKGNVRSDVWGDINSPAILSHTLSNSTLEALGKIEFSEDGKIRLQNSTQSRVSSKLQSYSRPGTRLLENKEISSDHQPIPMSKFFKRKTHGLCMKVRLPATDATPSKGSMINQRTTSHGLWSIKAAQEHSPCKDDGDITTNHEVEEPIAPQENHRRPVSMDRPLKQLTSVSRYSALNAELTETVKARASTYSAKELKQILHGDRK